MTDGVNVDWSLLKPTNPVGDYVNAFAVGRALGRSQAAQNAFSPAPAPQPPPPVPEAPPAAPDAPPWEPAARADLIAGIAQGLQGAPYGERRAMLTHLTPALAAHGLPAAAIRDFDPTDANLQAVASQVRSLAAGGAAEPAEPTT